jgi:two-component system sensor histidine kinase YesM
MNNAHMDKMYRIFFVKNLTRYLIPMLVPVLVLGTLSTVIIEQHVKGDINNRSMDFLKQTRDNIELIFTELDSLNMHIIASAFEFVNLKRMFTEPELDSEKARQLATLKNFIDSPAIARPYIDSIYIYLENDYNHFITSLIGGVINIKDFYDRDWLQNYKNNASREEVWTEARTVFRYGAEFEPGYINLMTMYRRLSVSDPNDGVIVLNVKPDYIEQQLAELSSMNGQFLLIIDKNYDVIFKNSAASEMLKYIDVIRIVNETEPVFTMPIQSESYVVNKVYSGKYGWTFVSMAPRTSLYAVSRNLHMINVFLLLFSLIAGTVLTYLVTRKNHKDIKAIVQILDSARKGEPLPPLPSRAKDWNSYIMQSIISQFIEKNYLKLQIAKHQYEAQALELTTLHAQLNPHFLFNTLETLNWKAASLTGRPNEVNRIVEHLSDILRYSLDNEQKRVSLQEEVRYTISYIEIQKFRYRDKFDIVWEYDGELPECRVMKLILQPLIENSLYHGIKEKEGKGRIKVKLRLVPLSGMEPGRMEPERVEPGRVEPERVEPGCVEPERVEPERVESGLAAPPISGYRTPGPRGNSRYSLEETPPSADVTRQSGNQTHQPADQPRQLADATLQPADATSQPADQAQQPGFLLEITVIDNGVGMLPDRLAKVRTLLQSGQVQSKHIGLYNTNRRLQLTYGDAYGIRICSKFGWGTAVRLTIPIEHDAIGDSPVPLYEKSHTTS